MFKNRKTIFFISQLFILTCFIGRVPAKAGDLGSVKNHGNGSEDRDNDKGSKGALATIDGIKVTKTDLNLNGKESVQVIIKKLAREIKKVIYDNAVKHFGIQVTDREIENKWKSITSNSGATMDQGAKLGIEALLIENKIDEAIDQEIASRDRDFNEYLKLIKSNADKKKLAKIVSDFQKRHGKTVSDYLQANRYLWWKAWFNKTTIIITDPKLEGARHLVHP